MKNALKDDLTLINDVLEKIPNKYMATVIAAKRAREINVGIRPLVKSSAKKPTTQALLEVAEGLIVPGPAKPELKPILLEPERRGKLPTPTISIDEPEEDEEDIMDTIMIDDSLIDDTEEDEEE